MNTTTARKVAAPAAPNNAAPTLATLAPRRSEYWLPARVARRLITRHGVVFAGRRALAQRERHGITLRASRETTASAFRWIYWDTVLIAIERRTELRFRDPVPLRARQERHSA